MPRRQKNPSSSSKLTDDQIKARLRAKFGARTSRTGGKGAARRKYKAAPKSSSQDDKRLSTQLKRLNVSPIPAIEEVNLFKEDGTVVHFEKPKVQAEIASNTYVVSGNYGVKPLTELIPDILPQLGQESMEKLKQYANQFAASGALDSSALDGGDVPKLVDANFEEVAKSDEKLAESKEASEVANEEDDDDDDDDGDDDGDAPAEAPKEEAAPVSTEETQQADKSTEDGGGKEDDKVPELVASTENADGAKPDKEAEPATEEATSLPPDESKAVSV